MAKSLRSKVKQAAGRKRRTDSHYAVAEAARIQRLSDKLLEKSEKQDEEGAAKVGEEAEGDDAEMKDDAAAKPSTSGPRRSGREEWKKAKGMPTKGTVTKNHGRGKGTTQHGGSKNFKPKRRR